MPPFVSRQIISALEEGSRLQAKVMVGADGVTSKVCHRQPT